MFKFYLVTDRRSTQIPLGEAVEKALEGGIRAVQLREKDLPAQDLYTLAMEIRRRTRRWEAFLFINDRVDVALAVKAEGVHLGEKSLPVSVVRQLVGDRLKIGVSIHHLEEALEAEAAGADFVVFGPVYETPSKRAYGPPQGLERLREVVQRIRIPVLAIGGVREDRLGALFQTGVFGVAMISAVLGVPDPRAAARRLIQTWEQLERGGFVEPKGNMLE